MKAIYYPNAKNRKVETMDGITAVQPITFEKWIAELLVYAKSINYYSEDCVADFVNEKIVGNDGIYTEFNDWRTYYDDGATPIEAVNTDLSYA